MFQGFSRKSLAPFRIAFTATSTEAQAVITMTGSSGMQAMELLDERDALLAGGRVARVVEVDERDVDVLARRDVEDAGGRRRRRDLESLALQQELQRGEDVRLVIRNEYARLHQADRAGPHS